jgi:hypothetical protein
VPWGFNSSPWPHRCHQFLRRRRRSRRVRAGVSLLSAEYRGIQCLKWSPFGARLDQILDQAAGNR